MHRVISIHALRAEGDRQGIHCLRAGYYFYPRPPCGGRPGRHADPCHRSDFYPRPPCGGRPACAALRQSSTVFLSTPSVRRATQVVFMYSSPNIFLSTPSVRRATMQTAEAAAYPAYFYPRPPCGGRLSDTGIRGRRKNISIHALRAEGDACRFSAAVCTSISIHALRAEGDTRPRKLLPAAADFYPRPPCGGRLPF